MTSLPTTLQAGPVELRRVDPEGVGPILEAVRASIDALHRWQPWAPMDYDRDRAMSWAAASWLAWNEGTAYTFTVHRSGEGEVLGTVGVNGIADGSANLGYWTRSDAVGQGIATAAARRCARFGFEEVGLRRIHLHHHVDNHGSRRVAEKAGFVREGVRRQVAELNGAFIDATFYSLVGLHEVS